MGAPGNDPSGSDAVETGHADVHEDHVGRRLLGEAYRFGPVSGLADAVMSTSASITAAMHPRSDTAIIAKCEDRSVPSAMGSITSGSG